MSIIKNQKLVADDILDKLEMFDPSCILAGGAPRDWYFKRPASDLDFYIYFRPDLPMQHLERLFLRLGLNLKAKSLSNPDIPMNYKHNPHLRRVYEGIYLGMKVQVMQMELPTFNCVVDLFPLDICMIWYKRGKIVTTREFARCVESGTIHIVNNLYSDKDRYLMKIKNKFPEFNWAGKK